ncbi:hypothetical protein B484DRAFT_389000 [Ochromonadaceae sp. CCMP2298]|nr:hypothetical protein B484DRAFT_389000 [Ochromonadaceae sp. CCMP2298]|mmetsp:Transcript_3870/g.8730  ORF Transcript_3870/g.8730 Transcript_3870/m.8730 type:complete len:124 (+) Transcript_3870:76-447(+)
MTIVMDYGFTMDTTSTTCFMVGGTIGEAGMPMLFGFAMEALGPGALPYAVLFCMFALAAVYCVVHILGGAYAPQAPTRRLIMDADTDEYCKISLDTGEDTDAEEEDDLEMTDMVFSPIDSRSR